MVPARLGVRIARVGVFITRLHWFVARLALVTARVGRILARAGEEKDKVFCGGRKPLSCSKGKPNYLYRVSSFILTFVKCSFMYFLVASMSLAQKASYIFKCS